MSADAETDRRALLQAVRDGEVIPDASARLLGAPEGVECRPRALLVDDPDYAALLYERRVPSERGDRLRCDGTWLVTLASDGQRVADVELSACGAKFSFDKEIHLLHQFAGTTTSYRLFDNGAVWPYPDANLFDEARRYPEASTRALTEAELAQRSTAELVVMRNEIFAARGYIFQTAGMRDYFAARRWYAPASEDVTAALTDIERENIDRLLATERARGALFEAFTEHFPAGRVGANRFSEVPQGEMIPEVFARFYLDWRPGASFVDYDRRDAIYAGALIEQTPTRTVLLGVRPSMGPATTEYALVTFTPDGRRLDAERFYEGFPSIHGTDKLTFRYRDGNLDVRQTSTPHGPEGPQGTTQGLTTHYVINAAGGITRR